MRRNVLIVILIAVLCAWLVWPSPYDRHFDIPLPATAQLDKYEVVGMGFDVFYAFRFTFTDDQFRDQIIKMWKLQKSDDLEHELTAFVSLKSPAWWPVDGLHRMDERYEREIETEARYWSVWIDRQNNYLYAEYGRW